MATLDRRKTYRATINIGPNSRRRQQPAAARRPQQVTPASPDVPAGGDTGFRFYKHPGMKEEVARINKKKAAEAARKREAKRRMMQEWAGISPKLTATQRMAKHRTRAARNRAMALQLAAYRRRRDVGATQ
jgi:hypothetical protein